MRGFSWGCFLAAVAAWAVFAWWAGGTGWLGRSESYGIVIIMAIGAIVLAVTVVVVLAGLAVGGRWARGEGKGLPRAWLPALCNGLFLLILAMFLLWLFLVPLLAASA